MVQISEVVEEVSGQLSVDAFFQFIKKSAYLLYIMNPKEHIFEKVEDVPDYYRETTPTFVALILMEVVFRYFTKKPAFRINDTISNICQGMLIEILKIPFLGAELIAYTWIYNNYRLVNLPWDSPWTWIIGLVFSDFCYYWMHRAGHSISFLWALHEIHHTSEEFNITVPMRLHVFTTALVWYAYFPMAFFIPPNVYLVHYQMIIVYQLLLHSEHIPHCRYVDWILNTPRLHRIHHGRQRKFIDKNFASVFVLWDRLFGTYQPVSEDDDDIVFGITTPVNTFNPFLLQVNPLRAMYKKFTEVKGVKNKISSIVKGPGWEPGKPWLGNLEDIPETLPDVKKYDPQIPTWMTMYVGLHFLATVPGYSQYILYVSKLPKLTSLTCGSFLVLTTMAFGGVLENRPWVMSLEISRSVLYFIVEAVVVTELGKLPAVTQLSLEAYRMLFLGTLFFWFAKLSMEKMKISLKKLHLE